MKVADITARVDAIIGEINRITGNPPISPADVDLLYAKCAAARTELRAIATNPIEGTAREVQECKTTLQLVERIVLDPILAAIDKKRAEQSSLDALAALTPADSAPCPLAEPARKYLALWRLFAKSGPAYRHLRTGGIWPEPFGIDPKSKVARPKAVTGPEAVAEFMRLSKVNMRRMIANLTPMDPVEQAFFACFTDLPVTLVHNTSKLYLIESSDRSISSVRARELAIKEDRPVDVNNNDRDERHLANTDFVFFRYSTEAIAAPVESRFGVSTLLFTPEQTGLFKAGWVSLYDMLHPVPSETVHVFSHDDVPLRISYSESYPLADDDDAKTAYLADNEDVPATHIEPELQAWHDGLAASRSTDFPDDYILHHFPQAQAPARRWVFLHMSEVVLYGADIRAGIGLAIIEQSRFMGAAGNAMLRAHLPPEPAPAAPAKRPAKRHGRQARQKTQQASASASAATSSAAAPRDPARLLHRLFRVEAKFPAFINLGGLLNVRVLQASYKEFLTETAKQPLAPADTPPMATTSTTSDPAPDAAASSGQPAATLQEDTQ